MHKIKKQKTDQGGEGYTLTLDRLTRGELITITRALKSYNSPVSQDVLAFIRNAIYVSNIEDLSKDIEDSLVQIGNSTYGLI